MVAWLKVLFIGVFAVWPLKLAALVVVPFLSDKQRVNHPIFGVADATDLSYKNIATRNAIHNFNRFPRVAFRDKANTNDITQELLEGVQWRHRTSLDGKYVSFRVTWGSPRKKGKHEFYIGYTMSEVATVSMTFFQLRVF